MPAPRLLDKKLVNANLATERKQEIDKGIQLAKSIEALRETRAKEERDLEEWRVVTVRTVQAQIASEEQLATQLREGNKILKAERIRLEGPIDLIEAWNEVHGLQEKNERISDNLLSREISITTRENDVHDVQALLFEREQEIQKQEIVTQENLRSSEEQRQEATDTNNEVQALLTKIKEDRAEFEAVSQRKTDELNEREFELNIRTETFEQRQADITREKILLADRRATLDRGFEELRRKNNGTNR